MPLVAISIDKEDSNAASLRTNCTGWREGGGRRGRAAQASVRCPTDGTLLLALFFSLPSTSPQSPPASTRAPAPIFAGALPARLADTCIFCFDIALGGSAMRLKGGHTKSLPLSPTHSLTLPHHPLACTILNELPLPPFHPSSLPPFLPLRAISRCVRDERARCLRF